MKIGLWALALAAVSLGAAAALPPEDYVQRVADTYRAAMQAQDYDGDGVLTREEARIDLLLSGAFSAIDTDGDDRITSEEMDRFVASLPDNPAFL
jgi:Ca2+-binding EF-hand superfamily protein